MAKISHTKSGLLVYLTPEEGEKIGSDLIDYQVFPKGEKVFLKLSAGSRRALRPRESDGIYQLCFPSVIGLPKFAAEEIETQCPVPGALTFPRPSMRKAPIEVNKGRRLKSHTNGQAPQAERAISLREAVRAINQHKNLHGDDLVFSITHEGKLEVTIVYS